MLIQFKNLSSAISYTSLTDGTPTLLWQNKCATAASLQLLRYGSVADGYTSLAELRRAHSGMALVNALHRLSRGFRQNKLCMQMQAQQGHRRSPKIEASTHHST
eukprot:s532_g32.t1